MFTKELVQLEAGKHAPLEWLKTCTCGMPYINHAAHMVVVLTEFFELIVNMIVAENDGLREQLALKEHTHD